MLQRSAFAVLLALLAAAPSLQADLGAPTGLTLTVKAGDKAISADDIALTQKKGYVHLMFNALPYPGADKAALPGILTELVRTEGLKAFPKAQLFKIDVVAISSRDDYGLPVWDKIKALGRYVTKMSKKGPQTQEAVKP